MKKQLRCVSPPVQRDVAVGGNFEMFRSINVYCATLNIALTFFVALAACEFSLADVVRYKDEALYLEALNQLDVLTITEGFESSDWDDARSPTLSDRSMVPEKLTQGILWEPAAKDVWGDQYSNRSHGLTTNHNWARGDQVDGWGLFEDHQGEAYPTTIRVSSARTIYGIGGWFDTNPDGESVGFLFEDRTTANDPGYYLPGFGAMYPGDNPSFGHTFVGIIDTDGFDSVVLTGTLEINEEGQLEGGTIFGADDFSIGLARTVPEPNFGLPLLALLLGVSLTIRSRALT